MTHVAGASPLSIFPYIVHKSSSVIGCIIEIFHLYPRIEEGVPGNGDCPQGSEDPFVSGVSPEDETQPRRGCLALMAVVTVAIVALRVTPVTADPSFMFGVGQFCCCFCLSAGFMTVLALGFVL